MRMSFRDVPIIYQTVPENRTANRLPLNGRTVQNGVTVTDGWNGTCVCVRLDSFPFLFEIPTKLTNDASQQDRPALI